MHTAPFTVWIIVALAATTPAATPTKPAPTAAAKPAASSAKAAAISKAAAAAAAHDSSSSSMTLRGGQDGTVFRTLTVEGEDRIHIEVDRPQLKMELNPEHAPGLDWGSARDVLDRTTPDLAAPLLSASAQDMSPYVARPWLSRFASGPVARFQPNVTGVDHWTLSIVNARGEVVSRREGRGDPPREMTWDGRLSSGGTLTPGATYSYVLEARDKAGNKRNFVGEGFRVGAVRFDGPGAPSLAFTGAQLDERAGNTPLIVLEAATWLNQWPESQRGVRVEAVAKSFDEANALAQRVTSTLGPVLLGDAARIQGVTTVTPDAPVGGAVRIAPGR